MPPPMNVFVANEQETSLDEGRAAALGRHVLGEEDVDDGAELSVLYVSAQHIKNLNSRFAGNDYATDVLAFPMNEDLDDDDGSILGDVVICPEIARDNAAKLGHDLQKELDTLLVHGTLHLLGYDHQKPEEKVRMDTRIEQVLGSFEARV